MGINYEFLNSFCVDVLSKDKALRWIGVINKNGVILAQKNRPGTTALLSEEENEEYAASVISRQKTRSKFESKIGKLLYAYGRYERLHRATIPINENFYLLIALDIEENNFNSIIMNVIVPLIENNRDKFISPGD